MLFVNVMLGCKKCYFKIYICIHSKIIITLQHIEYNAKPLGVVQLLYFASMLPSSGTYIYIYKIQQNEMKSSASVQILI